MMRKRLIRFILTWVMTLGIVAVLFSRIAFSDVLAVLRQMDLRVLCLNLSISAIAHILVSPAKYRQILKLVGCRLSFTEVVLLRMGGVAFNGLTPFKVGEAGRIAYLKTRHGLSYSRSTLSVILWYLFSFAFLALVVLTGWLLPQRGTLTASAVLIALAAGALLVLVKKREYLPLLIYSLIFEVLKVLNAFIVFRAFHIEVPFASFLFFMPFTMFIAFFPITFLGLGTRESAILFFFSGSASSETLVAGSLIISLVNRIFPLLLGVLFLKPFLDKLLRPIEK